MLKRRADACELALTRWRDAFQMRSRSAWRSPSTRPGREASSCRPSRSTTTPQSSSCAPFLTVL
eukprot:1456248-Pleurochrysis_carterae.AAC.1